MPISAARDGRWSPRSTSATSTATTPDSRMSRLSLLIEAPMWSSCGTASGTIAAVVAAVALARRRRAATHVTSGIGSTSAAFISLTMFHSRSSGGSRVRRHGPLEAQRGPDRPVVQRRMLGHLVRVPARRGAAVLLERVPAGAWRRRLGREPVAVQARHMIHERRDHRPARLPAVEVRIRPAAGDVVHEICVRRLVRAPAPAARRSTTGRGADPNSAVTHHTTEGPRRSARMLAPHAAPPWRAHANACARRCGAGRPGRASLACPGRVGMAGVLSSCRRATASAPAWATPRPGRGASPPSTPCARSPPIGVVLAHVAAVLVFRGMPLRWAAIGDAGVLVFFVLSGYLIASSVLRPARFDVRGYMIRRALRILPLYYASMLVALILIDPTPLLSGPGRADVATHVVLLHGLSRGMRYSIAGIWWTLTVEWLFYLFIAIVAVVFRRSPYGWLIAIGMILLGVVWRLVVFETSTSAADSAYLVQQLPGAADLFGIGMLTALAATHRRRAAFVAACDAP